MGLNISEVSGNSYGSSTNGLDDWIFDVDLTDPSVTVVTGNFEMTDPLFNSPLSVRPASFTMVNVELFPRSRIPPNPMSRESIV